MDQGTWLAERLEAHRTHRRAVAYRMLGSLTEADDAVQEAWLRPSRTGGDGVENLDGWLTTVVRRVGLDRLRSRRSRREEPLDSSGPHGPDGAHGPDPIVDIALGTDPGHEALQTDAVGLALLVLLETRASVERLAFLLPDVFAVPFEEIAPIVGRTPTAARQLASRARRRVQGAAAVPDADVSAQREVVNAFLAAARAGDFEALLAVLDPNVVRRLDRGAVPAGASRVVRGAPAVVGPGLRFAPGWEVHPALVNGAAGVIMAGGGRAASVTAGTFRSGKIVAIDILADPARIRRLGLPDLPVAAN
jgi:RNA polymerase sigma-70 factor (ECF subfamily)